MGAISSGDTVAVNARESKSKVVHARFAAAEMARIVEAAASAGLTVSGFIRSLTLEGAGVRPFFTDPDRAVLNMLLSEVRALGVNLNQLARAANRRVPGRSEEVGLVIDEVHQSIAALLLELRFFAERGARTRQDKA